MKYLALLFFLCIAISCGDSTEKQTMALTIEYQKNKISLLEEENSKLKRELANMPSKSNNDNIQRIGKWLDNRPACDTQMFLNKNLKNGKHYFVHKFKDGSSANEEVRLSKEKGLIRFEIIDSEHVEWFIIEKNGDLSMYGQSGKFATAYCF